MREPARRRRVLWTIFSAAAAVAVVGLSQRGLGAWLIYGYRQVPDTYAIFGSFLNRNHAASYLVMGIACGAALLVGEIRRIPRLTTSERFDGAARALLVSFLLLVSVVGLFKTSSRGAFLSVLPSGAVFILILMKRGAPLPGLPFVAVLPIAALSSIAFLGRIESLRGFIGMPDGSTTQRLSIYSSAIPFLGDSWLWGYGLGGVEQAFVPYQDFSIIATVVDHLHNDWAEIAAQLGIPAALILFIAWGLFADRAFRHSLNTTGQENAIVAGMFAGVTAIATHSFLDFPAAIPANAIAAISLAAGIGTLAPGPKSAVPYNRSGRWTDLATIVLCMAAAVWGLRRIPAWIHTDRSSASRTEVRPFYLTAAAEALPGPEAEYRLGTAYLTLADENPGAAIVLLRKALQKTDSALAETPEIRRYQALAGAVLWRLDRKVDADWHLRRKRP